MKIKTKKQFTLPQLIEWAWKNNIENKEFRAKDNYTEVIFGDDGDFSLGQMGFVEEKDTFTVEVEEELTKDTLIPKMIRIYEKDCLEDSLGYQRISIVENFSIGFELNRAKLRREEIKTIHIVNEDDTHTLIWCDGKLVE